MRRTLQVLWARLRRGWHCHWHMNLPQHMAEDVWVNREHAHIGCSCGQRFYRNEQLLLRLRGRA